MINPQSQWEILKHLLHKLIKKTKEISMNMMNKPNVKHTSTCTHILAFGTWKNKRFHCSKKKHNF